VRRAPLLIISEDIRGERWRPWSSYKLRAAQGRAVKAPGFGDRRKAMLEDIAVLTKGELISEELGINSRTSPWRCSARQRIEIDKETRRSSAAPARRRTSRAASADQGADRGDHLGLRQGELQERLAKLRRFFLVAVIRVAGGTEVEVKERKDRVDDAMHATRARSGSIVAGGGVALLYATRASARLRPAMTTEGRHRHRAPRPPGADPAIASNGRRGRLAIVGKLLEQKSTDYGFDAQKGEYVDMVKAASSIDQGRARGAAGRGFGRRPADHHRGDGVREAGTKPAAGGPCACAAAAWRMGGYGRHGGMDF